MKSWQPGKNTSDPYFCNQEFRNNNHFNKFSCEVILTSESKDFEIKDHFSRFLCQADSLPGFHFENHFGCALVPEKGLRRLQQKQNKTKQKNSKTYKTKQNKRTAKHTSSFPLIPILSAVNNFSSSCRRIGFLQGIIHKQLTRSLRPES